MPNALLSLPVELLLYVSRDVEHIRDLYAFSRSCRAVYNIATPLLYQLVKDDEAVLCWAVDEGRIPTVRRLLEAGADPNIPWLSQFTREFTLKRLERMQEQEDYYKTSQLPRVCGCGPDCSRLLDDDEPDYRPGDLLDFDDDSMNDYDDSLIGYDDDSLDDYYDSLYGGNSDTGSEIDDHIFDSLDQLRCDRGSFPQQHYWTPLHIAARWGNDEIVDLLLRYGANVHSLSRGYCECLLPDSESTFRETRQQGSGILPLPLWMPLHTAICYGHESTARLLISRGASINVLPRCRGEDLRRVTALHTACASNALSISRFLIDDGHQTDVNIEDHAGHAPVSHAYHSGYWESIDLLLEKGSTLNASLDSQSLLLHACSNRYFHEALRLVELGAEVNVPILRSHLGDTPLHYCCVPNIESEDWGAVYRDRWGIVCTARSMAQEPSKADAVRALVKAGVCLDTRNNVSETPLMRAAAVLDADIVEILLSAGADANATDRESMTALTRACASRHETNGEGMLNTVKALLRRITPDHNISQELEVLCENPTPHQNKVGVLKSLLTHGENTRARNRAGQKLFVKSILARNFSLCDVLQENGLRTPAAYKIDELVGQLIYRDDAVALNYVKKFPAACKAMLTGSRLSHSIDHGSTKCADVLLNAGALTDPQSRDARACLFATCQLGDNRLARLLLEKGVDPNKYSGTDDSPFTDPILSENADIVKTLLDFGGNVHTEPKSKHGNSTYDPPLQLAIETGCVTVVDTMVNHKAYDKVTEEQRAACLRLACSASLDCYEAGAILGILLGPGRADPNIIFDDVNTTPLHICLGLGNHAAVRVLVQNKADIHRQLPKSDKPPKRGQAANPFEGTTPLEWAIVNSPVLEVIVMLNECTRDLSTTPEEPAEDMLPLLKYVKAACQRPRPEILKALLKAGLDPNVYDEDGDNVLAMFCKNIDALCCNEESPWSIVDTARRSAEFVRLIVNDWDLDPTMENKEGISALDRFRRVLMYEGQNMFLQEVARIWNLGFEVREDNILIRAGAPGPFHRPNKELYDITELEWQEYYDHDEDYDDDTDFLNEIL